jgi:D-proline reductase (dithiol) PrdB
MKIMNALIRRWINQGLARAAGRWPALADKLVAGFKPLESGSIPWTEVTQPLNQITVALVTTAGVHHRGQPGFNMADPDGDPSFRVLDARTIETDYTITHDYYDHRDADRDLDIVFPLGQLKAMQAAGCIGAVARRHFGFMGHIDGAHVRTLINKTAARVAAMLLQDRVSAVLLTPA